MGQGAALDALHVKAPCADLIQRGGQLAGLVACCEQQRQPLALAGHGGGGVGAFNDDEPRRVVAFGVKSTGSRS